MVNRVQSLRSSTAKARPTGQLPGMIYTNWADKQIGVIDSGGNAMDLVAVRFFAATTSYAVGDVALQGGALYVANAAITAGAFNPAQWNKLQTSADVGSYAFLPLAGGTLTGALVLAGDPTTAPQAATKNYVDLHTGLVTISATPPASPTIGSLWWDSTGGQLYVYYYDGNTYQWVVAVTAVASLPVASTTVLGAVKVDGTTVQAAADGTVSVVSVAMNDNRIINGDMRIDQRNNGASGTAGGYTIDRWQYNASVASKGTWGRYSGGGTAGFQYLLGFTSSSAYTLLAADFFTFTQSIEADMIADFQWGTATAQSVTLSFWVNTTLTGTFGGSLRNNGNTRSYPFIYSVPTANTWTRIVITIPGDTAGTWTLSGNGIGVGVNFGLGVGTTYSGPAGAWASANYLGATGAVSIVSINGAGFNLTGVKLEIGSIATPFNRQSLTKSLADCQRYFEKSYDDGTAIGTATGNGEFFHFVTGLASAANNGGGFVSFKTTKRALPTMTFYSPNTGASGKIRDNNFGTDINPSTAGVGLNGVAWYGTMSAAVTIVNITGHYTASAEL